MSEAAGIAGVLRDHDWIEPRGYAWPCCTCGAEFPGGEMDAYAHVASAVVAWIGERLAAGDVVLSVARAIHGNTIGDPAKGEPIVRLYRETEDVIRDAIAALTAVRAALGEGVTGRETHGMGAESDERGSGGVLGRSDERQDGSER